MKKALFIFILSLQAFLVLGQSDSLASEKQEADVMMISSNADSAFAQARELAFNKDYDASRKVLDLLLQEDPDNYSYKLFRIRTQLWQGKHDEARIDIEKLIAADSTQYKIYELRVLNELYDKDYEICLRHCEDGIKRFPKQNEFFYVQKVQALTSANEYHDALDAANEAEKKFPNNNEIKQLKTFLLNQLIVDGVAAGLFIDYFTKNYNPWLYGFVQVGRQTKMGAFIARLNVAERFADSRFRDNAADNSASFGVQGEIDAYPRLGRKSYA